MGVITVDQHMGKTSFRRKPSGTMFAGKPSHLLYTRPCFFNLIWGNIFILALVLVPVPARTCSSCSTYCVCCALLMTIFPKIMICECIFWSFSALLITYNYSICGICIIITPLNQGGWIWLDEHHSGAHPVRRSEKVYARMGSETFTSITKVVHRNVFQKTS